MLIIIFQLWSHNLLAPLSCSTFNVKMINLRYDSYCLKISTAVKALFQVFLNYIIIGDLVSNLGLFMS